MVGIRDTYPLVPAAKFAAYLACARPFTWLAPLVGVVCAAGMATRYGYTSWASVAASWHLLVYGATTLLLLVVGNNFVNQSTDREDAINRAYRPVVRGLVSSQEAATIGHFLWFAALLRAATISVAFGVLVALLVTISYAYSHPPIRLKARPWLGNAAIAVARGGLGFLAAWSLWAPPLALPALMAALVLTVFLVGATTAKDFADLPGDAACGVRTLPVKYGPATAALLSHIWIVGGLTLLFVLPLELSPLTTGLALLAGLGLMASMETQHDKPNAVLEGNRPWLFMYLALLALQVALAF